MMSVFGFRGTRRSGASGFICMLLSVSFAVYVVGYRPVIIVHGLFDSPKELVNLSRFISKSHPGTNVTVIDLFDYKASLKPMWKQVQGFTQAVRSILQNAVDGVHLICFSQGGLVCRGIVSTLPDHNIHSFISLSSPQGGQYGDEGYFVREIAKKRKVLYKSVHYCLERREQTGSNQDRKSSGRPRCVTAQEDMYIRVSDTEYLKYAFPKFLKRQVYKICYCSVGQKLSICNYWKDPHHIDQYVKGNDYLALLNSERLNPSAAVWKKNFLRITKLVLIGGPDDGVITPWQSSHFGFYDENEEIVEMKDQDVYVKDVFGLKTLDARGDLVVCVFPGVKHTSWHSNEAVYNGCIDKWLT